MDRIYPWTGWQLVPSPDRAFVDVLDANGVGRARVLGLGHQLHPRERETVEVHLLDGRRTTLTNGTRWWGTRRGSTRGLLPLGEVTYVLQHRTGSRARLLRDGAWLATLFQAVPTPAMQPRSAMTEEDHLAAAVLGMVLQPGRESLLGSLAGLLGGS